MFFEEVWISYLVGATIWIASKYISQDLDEIPRVLKDNNITVFTTVPTIFQHLPMDSLKTVRIVNLGGEAVLLDFTISTYNNTRSLLL